MSDFFDEPEEDEGGSPEEAFSEMEASLDGSVPASDYITIRHEAGAPFYVTLNEGETTITVQEAINKRGLTVGVVSAYVDGAVIPLTQAVPAGTIVTLVGAVKGG